MEDTRDMKLSVGDYSRSATKRLGRRRVAHENAERQLREQQTEPVVESTGGIRATNRMTSSTMDSKANLDPPRFLFLSGVDRS